MWISWNYFQANLWLFRIWIIHTYRITDCCHPTIFSIQNGHGHAKDIRPRLVLSFKIWPKWISNWIAIEHNVIMLKCTWRIQVLFGFGRLGFGAKVWLDIESLAHQTAGVPGIFCTGLLSTFDKQTFHCLPTVNHFQWMLDSSFPQIGSLCQGLCEVNDEMVSKTESNYREKKLPKVGLHYYLFFHRRTENANTVRYNKIECKDCILNVKST